MKTAEEMKKRVIKRLGRRAARKEGFSLMEIMIVIALIALFAVLVGPNVIEMFTSGQEDAARVQIKQVEQALKLYYRNCGRYPSTAQGLNSLISKTSSCKRWKKVLDGDTIPEDPWGSDYLYFSPGVRGDHEYELISKGKDAEDESDDITSFTKGE